VITDRDIARWRLRSQHLVEPYAGSAADVVRSLLAVQAENPGQSAWAVAARTSCPREDDLGSLLEQGLVVRTHVLRPTWHYVAADDIVWLLELTAPRVLKTVDQQLRGPDGFDDSTLDRLSTDVLDALGRAHLTRAGLNDVLVERGHRVSGYLLMLLVAHLELHGLVCSGPPADGVHTYALMADRVPSPRRLDREEALAELALRYVTGHGPATERDLAYWATLTVTDVRKGLAAAGDRLASFEHDGRTFWHVPEEVAPTGPGRPPAHLLQILDETYRGFQDSRWALDADGLVPRTRETAIGMALVDAQIVAAMKRTVTDAKVTFDLRPMREVTDEELSALEAAAARYADFLDREPGLRFV